MKQRFSGISEIIFLLYDLSLDDLSLYCHPEEVLRRVRERKFVCLRKIFPAPGGLWGCSLHAPAALRLKYGSPVNLGLPFSFLS